MGKYVTKSEKAMNASSSLIVVGLFFGFLIGAGVYVGISLVFNVNTDIDKLVYEDFQAKKYTNIPSDMKEGYESYLKDIKVKKLEKEIQEGSKN